MRISKKAAVPGAESGFTTPSDTPVTGGDTAGCATGIVGGGESAGFDEHAEANAVTRVNTPAVRSWTPDFVCNGPKNS